MIALKKSEVKMWTSLMLLLAMFNHEGMNTINFEAFRHRDYDWNSSTKLISQNPLNERPGLFFVRKSCVGLQGCFFLNETSGVIYNTSNGEQGTLHF